MLGISILVQGAQSLFLVRLETELYKYLVDFMNNTTRTLYMLLKVYCRFSMLDT